MTPDRIDIAPTVNPLDHDVHARAARRAASREMWIALRRRLFTPRPVSLG